MADGTVALLDSETVRRIRRTAVVEIGDAAEAGLFVAGSRAQIQTLLRIVRSVLSEDGRDRELIDGLLEDTPSGAMDPEHLLQLRAQASAREAFLRDACLLDGAEIGRLLGSTEETASATASRLKSGKKLFAVTYRGVDLYPAAQIVGGEPSPAIPNILEAFSKDSPWTLACWLTAPSVWLDGEKPLRRLATNPDRVVWAAQMTTASLRF